MQKTMRALAALLAAGLAAGAAAPDATSAIAAATKALGAENLSSITYSGSAADVNFLQTQDINGPWPTRAITNYVRAMDLAQPASRATGATNNPGIQGGAGVPGTFVQNITPANAAWAQQLEIYITPWGFLKGAAANHATAQTQKIGGKTFTVVSWTTPQKAPSGVQYKVNGYINDQNMVDRVETWLEHPTLGDMHVEGVYSAYQDFGGVKVPTKMVQKRAGWETFEVTVTNASANPGNIEALLNPPQQGKQGGGGGAGGGAPAAAPVVTSEKLAEGVYRITGGYVSMAVEFKDFVLVCESGQSEARGLAILAETKRLFPNKPIRYVFNSHPHSDHTAGLAPFVAEDAIILTQAHNKKYLLSALGAPRTLVGDTLAKANKKPKVEIVAEKMVLKDGMRSVEFHHIANLSHSNGMLIAYLPKEKILFQADFTLPAPGQPANEFVVALVQNLDRLKLDFDRYVPVHAPNPDVPWTKADLMKAVGRN